jgi:hypothetical protein
LSEASAEVRSVYAARLSERRDIAQRAARASSRLSNARLAVFAVGLAVAWLAYGVARIDPLWLGAVVAAFAALVVVHDRALQRQGAAERAAAYYEGGLARLDHRFAGRGQSGERFLDPHHPYAADLDLFGAGSVFELLCRARTRGGEETLARWLLAPADPDALRARQQAVAELRPRIDLREQLALVGETAGPGLHPEALLDWGESAPPAPALGLRIAAAASSLVSGALAVSLYFGVPPFLLLLVLAIQSGFAVTLRGRVRRCATGLDRPLRDLELLAELLEALEREDFESPLLTGLARSVARDSTPASRRIRQLRRLGDLLDARRNQLFAPFGALLLFTTQIALAIDAWRARFGPSLGDWLVAAAELEALASLASHAFEHPDDCTPEIEAGRLFVAIGAGHPLIPEETCVRNDVRLDDELRVLLVSGSNMSGKSTLLRTVGVNTVLALAGATVRAASLRVSPLALGASIRTLDSLQEGSSRFYAEITRLRQIVELTEGRRPVLFLLDEILHGTNSHDRLVGAEAVVRSLAERGAIGLVTTHDLALTRVADALEPHAANVHFQDHLEHGEMRFDYRMQPGVVTRSNALELMRSVGLDV